MGWHKRLGGNIPKRDTSPADIHRMMVRPPDCAFTATPDGEINIPAPITVMYRLNSTVLVSLLNRVYHLERLLTHLAADLLTWAAADSPGCWLTHLSGCWLTWLLTYSPERLLTHLAADLLTWAAADSPGCWLTHLSGCWLTWLLTYSPERLLTHLAADLLTWAAADSHDCWLTHLSHISQRFPESMLCSASNEPRLKTHVLYDYDGTINLRLMRRLTWRLSHECM